MFSGALRSILYYVFFFFSSRRRHTRSKRDWSSDVCSSDLKVQRIAAQKSLELDERVSLISHDRAMLTLSMGHDSQGNKMHYRWGSKPATHFLSDYAALLQALFSEHNQIASKHLNDRKQDLNVSVPT